MAAVLGGMSVLELVQLIAALDAAGLTLLKIRDELQKGGAKEGDPLPLEIVQSVSAALKRLTAPIDFSQPGSFMESRSQGAEV